MLGTKRRKLSHKDAAPPKPGKNQSRQPPKTAKAATAATAAKARDDDDDVVSEDSEEELDDNEESDHGSNESEQDEEEDEEAEEDAADKDAEEEESPKTFKELVGNTLYLVVCYMRSQLILTVPGYCRFSLRSMRRPRLQASHPHSGQGYSRRPPGSRPHRPSRDR